VNDLACHSLPGAGGWASVSASVGEETMIIKQPCLVDASHWEIVDWNNFDPRVLGVIWKITQGKYYIDPTCASFWAGAGALGLPRSVFHFFEPNDISAQVENFLTACEDIGIIVSGRWMA